MRSFEQFENHVSVDLVAQDPKLGTEILETVNVPFLVGTDGAHSVTRKTLGLTFLGDTRHDVDMVVGDIEIKSGLDPKVWLVHIRVIPDYLIDFLLQSWHVWGESSTRLLSDILCLLASDIHSVQC